MISRYTLPEMGAIWEPKNKFDIWLKIEIAACEAWADLGEIPKEALKEIQKNADFNIQRIDEIEKETRHDVIAFTTCLSEYIGPSSRYIHLGLTSSDVVDTAFGVQLKQASRLIIKKLDDFREVLKKQAQNYKNTITIGRSHGIHAEPTTFGIKLANWYSEVCRDLQRMKRARDIISIGKVSGAVGTFANISPKVEKYICKKLGLKPAPVSSQIIQRDRHAEFFCTLAIIASSLDKFAVEIRNLQRTEILEAEEFFSSGQKGSSAMPHKRNPVVSEQISGLARIIRGNASAALENVPLWHERDISHSSVERIIGPDSCILLDYMLTKMSQLMARLVVYPENMRKNLEKTNGLIFSQNILLALTRKGVSREESYKIVQRNAMATWKKGGSFLSRLKKDRDVKRYLTIKELEKSFDLNYHLKNVDEIFRRVF